MADSGETNVVTLEWELLFEDLAAERAVGLDSNWIQMNEEATVGLGLVVVGEENRFSTSNAHEGRLTQRNVIKSVT